MFSVYPNPAFDEVNLVLNQKDPNYALKVYDVSGKLVYNTTIKNGEFNAIYTLKLHDFVDGTYIIEMNNANESFKQKIIIQ